MEGKYEIEGVENDKQAQGGNKAVYAATLREKGAMTTQNVIVKVFRPIKLQGKNLNLYTTYFTELVGAFPSNEAVSFETSKHDFGHLFLAERKLGERKRQVAHFDVFCSL